MNEQPYAVEVAGLGKQYKIGALKNSGALYDTAAGWLGRRRNRLDGPTVWALRDVTFKVAPGQVVGLLGRNGAGKTTTFKSIIGLIRVEAGSITLKGTDITKLPVYRRARMGMGFLS